MAAEMFVVIYRKDVSGPKYGPDFAKAPTKAQKSEADESLELIARVRRPEVEAFLRDGFYNLPALPTKVIDNKGLRLLKHRQDGWVVPVGSLGRSGRADRSAVESIRLWIAQNMGHVVNPDHLAIVVQPMP